MLILIIDDSEGSRALLKAILRKYGYNNLKTAESADVAFKKHLLPDCSPPDLILMDILMPGLDGISATHMIKSRQELRDIPIVMVTGKQDKQTLESAFQAGAMDFINKPINQVELLARVGSALKLKREMDRRKSREMELSATVGELKEALSQVRQLSGLLPICAVCKKIRDDEGYWNQLEDYIQTRSEAEFSHGLCPDCLREHYPEIKNWPKPNRRE